MRGYGSGFSRLAIVLISVLGACESTDEEGNLVGAVRIDDQAASGVGVSVEDTIGNVAETTTDGAGRYGFVVLPGEQTVRLISGIPDDAECAPGIEQTVSVPEDGVAVADFACETPGSGGMGGVGGMGGTGGMAGTGGSGGGGGGPQCGVAQDSPTVDLAGDVTVAPMSGPEGTMFVTRVPVTAGVREVFLDYAITAQSAAVGTGFAQTSGAETVSITITARPQQGDPIANYPGILELVGTNPNMGVFYITTDSVVGVERSTRNGQTFTDPVLQPLCDPFFFALSN